MSTEFNAVNLVPDLRPGYGAGQKVYEQTFVRCDAGTLAIPNWVVGLSQ